MRLQTWMANIFHQKLYTESVHTLFDVDLTWLIVSFEHTELLWKWQNMIIDLAVRFSLSHFSVCVCVCECVPFLISLCCVNCPIDTISWHISELFPIALYHMQCVVAMTQSYTSQFARLFGYTLIYFVFCIFWFLNQLVNLSRLNNIIMLLVYHLIRDRLSQTSHSFNEIA